MDEPACHLGHCSVQRQRFLFTCGVTNYKPGAWLLVAARVRPKYGDVHSQMWHPPVHRSRKHVPWTRTAWRDGAKNFSPSISFWNQNKELHTLENTKTPSISYLAAVHKDRQLNPKSLQLTTTSHCLPSVSPTQTRTHTWCSELGTRAGGGAEKTNQSPCDQRVAQCNWTFSIGVNVQ